MFYSHQLLSRKGPLAQIWIVATMQTKINRRKAEQINIEEICMQVLQPQVPLALRLTGILMGGIVLIYDRKVRILHDDVNEFLFKLKTAVDTRMYSDKKISLPKSKLQARFENVTITYDFDTFDNIETALYAPNPSEENLDNPEYVRSTLLDPYQRLSTRGDSNFVSPTPHLNQVNSEDITLEERITADAVHQQYEDFGINFQEDRIPPPNNTLLEDFFPEQRETDESRPGPCSPHKSPENKQGEEGTSERKDTSEPNTGDDPPPLENERLEQPEQVVPDQTDADRPSSKRRKVQGRRARKTAFDLDFIEISAPVFASWIRETSDIRERKKQVVTAQDPKASVAGKMLNLPSTCLLSPACVQGLEPFWPGSLAKLWERTLNRNLPRRTGSEAVSDLPANNTEDGSKELADSVPSTQRSGSSGEIDGVAQPVSPVHSAPLNHIADLNQDPVDAFANFTSEEVILESNDPGSYGSVEKLRTALQSPNVLSEDFLGNLFGRTSGQSGHSRSDKSWSTPRSNRSSKLALDPERDSSTDGSVRNKRTKLSGSFRSNSPNIFGSISPSVEGVESTYDLFPIQAHNLPGALSRFGLMEDVESEAPQESKKVQISSSLLQYLVNRFKQGLPPTQKLSLFEMSEGLRKEEAARLFYQICVLSSNLFLTVEQGVPYGDVRIGRGLYMS